MGNAARGPVYPASTSWTPGSIRVAAPAALAMALRWRPSLVMHSPAQLGDVPGARGDQAAQTRLIMWADAHEVNLPPVARALGAVLYA